MTKNQHRKLFCFCAPVWENNTISITSTVTGFHFRFTKKTDDTQRERKKRRQTDQGGEREEGEEGGEVIETGGNRRVEGRRGRQEREKERNGGKKEVTGKGEAWEHYNTSVLGLLYPKCETPKA